MITIMFVSFTNKIGADKSMKKRNYNTKSLIVVVIILILIESVALIITDGFGKNFIENIVVYILEILVTIWIIAGKENKK